MLTLLVGDSLAHLKDMDDDSVEAIITDPPYDFKDDVKEEFHNEFLRVAKGTVIVFAPPENQWIPSEQYLFWIKPISTKNTSRKYSRFVEVIHVYRSGRSKWNPDRHWSQYVNVFNDSVESKIVHPFQKPMAMMERLIKNHTDRGDRVLDPFCGSGTTALACLRTERECTGLEIDPKTADICMARVGAEHMRMKKV